MKFSNAFFRILALIGVALLLWSIPSQRERLGDLDRYGHSFRCIRLVGLSPGFQHPCAAQEEFEHILVEAEIARFKRMHRD